MLRTMLKSTIHRATVTRADPHHVGSVTVDADLMAAADLLPGEQVVVVDVTNGARLESYVVEGPPGSGVLGVNGAAAQLVRPGDVVTVIAHGLMDDVEAAAHRPRVVSVDADNRVVEPHAESARMPTDSDPTSGASTEPVAETADAAKLDALLQHSAG